MPLPALLLLLLDLPVLVLPLGLNHEASEIAASPPVALRRAHTTFYGTAPPHAEPGLEHRGPSPMQPPVTRTDPYYWLRDDARQDVEVLSLLRAENAYTQHQTAHLQKLRETIYGELKARLQETDETARFRSGAYLYFTRTIAGQSYAIHCRCLATLGSQSAAGSAGMCAPGAAVEVLLDENDVAAGLPSGSQMSVHSVVASPGHHFVAYTIDTTGYETFDLHIRDLGMSGSTLAERLEGTDGNVVWSADERRLYYVQFDDQHRPAELWQHTVGTPQSADALLYTEQDQLFALNIKLSTDRRYLLLMSACTETSEVHMLYLGKDGADDAATQQLQVVARRSSKTEYDVDVRGSTLYIQTNRNAPNYRIMTSPLAALDDGLGTASEQWKQLECVVSEVCREAFGASETVTVRTLRVFSHHLVVEGRERGVSRVWILSLTADDQVESIHEVVVPITSAGETQAAPGYSVNGADEEGNNLATLSLDMQQNRDADCVRLVHSSLTTPERVVEYVWPKRTPAGNVIPTVSNNDANDSSYSERWKELRVVKATRVQGFKPNDYHSWRMWAPTVADSVLIPISCVRRRRSEGALDTPGPMLLYGYGSYGLCVEPEFHLTSQRLPLIDRGVTLCLAHVRGGGEMGKERWYEQGGKYLTKRNTFTDFIAVARLLLERQLTVPSLLAIEGRSAGGLLVGAVINMEPTLFNAAVSAVPFTDVLTTMRDPTIPLTVGEWQEWGNPNEEQFYEYIASYSPVDNVPKGPMALRLPAILATAGLHDPRVAFWEPIKWIQTLRYNRRMALGTSDGQGAGMNASARGESELPPLLLKMDLDAGHFSASDRYNHLRELAFGWAFLLDRLRVKSSAMVTHAHVQTPGHKETSLRQHAELDENSDPAHKVDL